MGPGVRQQNPTHVGYLVPGGELAQTLTGSPRAWIPGMSQSAGSATPGFRPARPRPNERGKRASLLGSVGLIDGAG